MDRKDYLKSRISEALKGPIEESYKKKYETAPEGVKAVADHMAMLKKQPTDTLERMANQHYKVHSAKSKNEFIGMLMRAKFGKKKLEAHDSHFQTEQKQGVAEGSGYNIDQADRDEFHPDEIARIKQAHFPDKLRRNLRDKKIAQAKQDRFNKLRGSDAGGDSKHITPVGHSSNNTYESVAEGSSGVSVRHWANKVRKDHGSDVKFRNRQEGGGAVDSVIAKNSQGETVGVYNRKTRFPTVYAPKQGVAESSFTAAASMHAATRKQSGGKTAQPTHGIKVGDAVTTADGKQGRVKFVHGDDIQVTGTNPYYRDRVTNHSAKDLKKSVAEATAWDSDSGTEREVKHFAIVNRKTERRVGTATTAVAAKRAADRHDTKYGANVHSVRPVWAEEYEPVNEASQKLMNYLRDKHGAALQKMSSPELQKAKKAAAAEMKAKTAEKKAAAAEAPKEKVKDTGEHIVVQMRKIADYKPGKYPVRVSPKRSVNVHSDAARKVVASHDQLKKPVEKRKFRISLTQRLRKLKEQLENGRR